MTPRREWTLSRKILGLALLNLVLIAAVLAMFAECQFGLSAESLVLGPARDRIMAIANAAARDLDRAGYSPRRELLDSYSRRFGVDFFLFDPRGGSLRGPRCRCSAAGSSDCACARMVRDAEGAGVRRNSSHVLQARQIPAPRANQRENRVCRSLVRKPRPGCLARRRPILRFS